MVAPDMSLHSLKKWLSSHAKKPKPKRTERECTAEETTDSRESSTDVLCTEADAPKHRQGQAQVLQQQQVVQLQQPQQQQEAEKQKQQQEAEQEKQQQEVPNPGPQVCPVGQQSPGSSVQISPCPLPSHGAIQPALPSSLCFLLGPERVQFASLAEQQAHYRGAACPIFERAPERRGEQVRLAQVTKCFALVLAGSLPVRSPR